MTEIFRIRCDIFRLIDKKFVTRMNSTVEGLLTN